MGGVFFTGNQPETSQMAGLKGEWLPSAPDVIM